MRGNLASNGFGLFAVELPEIAPFIGFVGLNAVTFDTHFTPAVEIAWRLASAHWGHGFATEAGRLVLEDGFHRLDLPEIVSFTTEENHRSRRVMDRLGMTWDAEGGFLHPRLPEGHNLSKHVLYRLKRSDFEKGKIGKITKVN
jgi:ribosomal-protein-alanine N-acetyltransferase